MEKSKTNVMSSLSLKNIALAVVMGALGLVGTACDECKTTADCKLGQICQSGSCVKPPGFIGTEDSLSDEGTDDSASTDPATETVDTGTGTGEDTASTPEGTDDSDSDSASVSVCRDPDEDCPASVSECRHYVCEADRCVPVDAEDGSSCTASDNSCVDGMCLAGQCVAVPLSGTACEDDGNPCTRDVCQAGACAHPPLSNGTDCQDDGNPCTEDVCYSGVCGRPLSGISCGEGSGTCGSAWCESGECKVTSAADNTPCDDGSWCNGSVDRCVSGVCTPREGAGPCLVLQPCHRGVCTEPVAPGTQGTCEELLLDGESCEDGLFCDGVEICDAGVCKGASQPCGALSTDCALEACDEAADQCVMQTVADGTPCPTQDGLACNGTEKCEAGSCTNGAPFCTAFSGCQSRQCHENSGDPYCDEAIFAPDGTPCETTNLCDGSGTRACVAGLCADGETPACRPEEQDGNLCTGYQICVVEDDLPRCLFALDGTAPENALEIGCGSTIEVNTANTNNEVSAYEAPACAGDFMGGEIPVGLALDPGTAYTATLVTTASTLGDDLFMVLVTDPCDADGTCLKISDTSLSSTSPSDSQAHHFLIIDGLSGNRGTATLTVTCP